MAVELVQVGWRASGLLEFLLQELMTRTGVGLDSGLRRRRWREDDNGKSRGEVEQVWIMSLMPLFCRRGDDSSGGEDAKIETM